MLQPLVLLLMLSAAPTTPPAGGTKATPTTQRAAPPCRSLFSGTWRYAGGEKQRAQVRAEIEAMVKRLNFLIRWLGRRRLRSVCKPYPTIRFVWRKKRLEIVVPREFQYRARPDGREFDGKNKHGHRIKLRLSCSGRTLREKITGIREPGWRTNTFTLHKDGRTMTMRSVLFSNRFHRKLTFSLTYRKR